MTKHHLPAAARVSPENVLVLSTEFAPTVLANRMCEPVGVAYEFASRRGRSRAFSTANGTTPNWNVSLIVATDEKAFRQVLAMKMRLGKRKKVKSPIIRAPADLPDPAIRDAVYAAIDFREAVVVTDEIRIRYE
jgi:hypothetical protein